MDQRFAARIASREAKIAVLGLGYVGLPLALAFADAGFTVIGYDVDEERVRLLRDGRSPLMDIPSESVARHVASATFAPSTHDVFLATADVLFVCVPTPFDRAKSPDLSYIEGAGRTLAGRLRRDQLVLLESTTYPGTTEEVLVPILERSGLRAGKDFFVAFSPERIDPGNRTYTIANTSKVVGGIDAESTERAALVLEQVVHDGVVRRVSTPRVAELTKLLENTYRAVNIALVNELAMLCDRMGIDVWEVIDAAKTKPYGFMPFYPGPGVGGHCLLTGESIYARRGALVGRRTLDELWLEATSRRSAARVGDTEVVTDPGFEALAIGVDGAPMWEPATHLFRRQFHGEVVLITTEDGRVVNTTDRHPMLVVTDRVLTTEARDVAPGELLPIVVESASIRTDRVQGDSHLVRGRSRQAGTLLMDPDVVVFEQAGQMVARVKTVERRLADVTVFSLETRTTHTFATGEGIFVHNCIPVDPYYLAWKAREFDFTTKFIEIAADTNLEMPSFTVEKLRREMRSRGKRLEGARILALGAAFKRDIDDSRNSAAVRVMEILRDEGAELSYHDPYVPQLMLAARQGEDGERQTLHSVDLDDALLASADCVLILVGHSAIDYARVLDRSSFVFDAVNATAGTARPNLVRL